MLDSFPSKRTVLLSLSLLHLFFFFAFFIFLSFFSFSFLLCTKVFSALFRKIFLKRDPAPGKRVRYIQKRYKYRNFFSLFHFSHAFSCVHNMYLESYPAGSQWASFTFSFFSPLSPPRVQPLTLPFLPLFSFLFLSFSFFFYYSFRRSMVFAKHKKRRRAKKRNDNRARAITKRPFDSPLKGFYTRLLSSPFNRKTAVIIYRITARLWIFRVIK